VLSYSRRALSVLLVAAMMLSGCSGQIEEAQVIVTGCTDDSAINFNPDADENDPESCTYSDEGDEENDQTIISLAHEEGCDNTNPIHCMLPFPSHAFLKEDNTTETGLRMDYSENTIPGSGLTPVVSIPIINNRDGVSPSTQIMTAFYSDPDISALAGQYSIEKSMEETHNTKLLNMETGLLIPHWVELDVRSEEDQPTILHIRTIKSLDHNTPYAVSIHGLVDILGKSVEPHAGFAALRDGVTTDSPDIESQRAQYEVLFASLSVHTSVVRENLQAAWMFHTASTESLIGDVLKMRNDAMNRIGTQGLGCSVDSSSEIFNDGNRTHWLLTGTYTAPQYTDSFFAPTLISRDAEGLPQFVENREIPFWLMIPNSAFESGKAAPLTVWGHGFLGDGNTSGLWGWGNENNVAMIGTSFYGWSSDDVISIEYAVIDIAYFQHQAERLQQAMVNQAVMVRTFMGVCSDLPEFYTNGSKLVDPSNPTYTGYSNGGLRGPSIIGLSPDLNRGVLWAGGSAFSHIIERCTQYDRFYSIFASDVGFPNQMDRAIAMSIAQYLWDPTETDTFLHLMQDGYKDEVEPFELMTLFSIGDFQISNISSSRMMRTGGIPLLNSSTITPYGMSMASDGHVGSVGVFFDGGYELAPEGNEYGEEPHPAHNAIGGLEIARSMAFQFLMNGTVVDTCNGDCTFSQEGLTWS
tara:strand:- start:7058 stop:9139 length:2082 start_codon:yes stop_codon:yes gene_type:complete